MAEHDSNNQVIVQLPWTVPQQVKCTNDCFTATR